MLGLTPKYIDEKFDEIVDFSELREFLDVPLKNYSSGMVARIAFAIATITKPDVLIADEILSVGDFMFQEKCEERMRQLMSGGTTVLLVSHSIGQIERMCDHVHGLEKGRVKMQGEAAEVCAAYKALDPEAAAIQNANRTRGSLRRRKGAHHRRGSRRPARAAGPAHPPGPRRVIRRYRTIPTPTAQ